MSFLVLPPWGYRGDCVDIAEPFGFNLDLHISHSQLCYLPIAKYKEHVGRGRACGSFPGMLDIKNPGHLR